MPIPAVTLTKSITQSSQNCGVFQASVDRDIVLDDQRGVPHWRYPAFRLPARGRDTDREDAEHHEDEVEHAHGDHGVRNRWLAGRFEVGHQIVGQRAANHRAAAEAHDGESGGQAGAVREPLNQSGDRRDVAQSQADAANNAIAQIDQRELMRAGS